MVCGWNDKCDDIQIENDSSQSNDVVEVRTRQTNQPGESSKILKIVILLCEQCRPFLTEDDVECNAHYREDESSSSQNDIDNCKAHRHCHLIFNWSTIIGGAL